MDEEELKRLVDSMIKGGESEEAIAMVIRKYSKPVKPEKKTMFHLPRKTQNRNPNRKLVLRLV